MFMDPRPLTLSLLSRLRYLRTRVRGRTIVQLPSVYRCFVSSYQRDNHHIPVNPAADCDLGCSIPRGCGSPPQLPSRYALHDAGREA